MRDYAIRVECLTPQLLIERAVARGACLNSVRFVGPRSVIIHCNAAGLTVIQSLCDRFSIPVRLLARSRAETLVAFARRRCTLLAGIAVFIALSAFFLCRVWRVDIAFSGEAAGFGDRAALVQALSDAGVRPGVLRRSVDPGLLAQTLQGGSKDYSYVGVRLQGIRMTVNAVPEVPAPSVYDVNAARDLVADRDGIVLRAVARSGTLCVKPGDAVRRGQLLIRGEELQTKEETRPIAALGEVIVRAWYTGRATLPLYETVQRPTGRSACASRLVGPFIDWTLQAAESFDSQWEQTLRLPIGGLFLPVEIVRSTRRETEAVSREIDHAVLKERLAALAGSDAAQKLCARQRDGAEIRDRWINYTYADGALSATAIIEIQANAAVTREEVRGG